MKLGGTFNNLVYNRFSVVATQYSAIIGCEKRLSFSMGAQVALVFACPVDENWPSYDKLLSYRYGFVFLLYLEVLFATILCLCGSAKRA